MLKLDAVLVLHVTRVSAGGRVADAKFTNARNPGSTSTSEQSRYELRDDWYAALLLADAPVQDWRAATRTLDMILSYRESPERWPVYDQFPPLLVLAENVRHAERLQQLARTCADLQQMPPLRGALAVVPHPPSLPQSCDVWRLPWHDLETGLSCHLTQVMSRFSHDAVPPNSDGSDALKPLSARKRTIIVPQLHARVVVGRLTERALSAAHERSQPDSHAGIPRQSLCLLSLQLGARLTDILTLLLRAPGIQVVDLADLLGIQLPSMDRYLSELDHWGLLRRCRNTAQSIGNKDRSIRASQQNHLSYDPSTAVWLSDSGHRLVTVTQRMSPQSQFVQRAASRHPQRGEDFWVPTVHDLGVYHFFALLARAAAAENYHLSQEPLQSAQHRLIWWEVGMLAERRYRYQGRWHHLRPDGAGCFRADAKLFRFWLEWDQGSMNLSDLTRKFMSYYTYLASGAWREAFDRVNPHLLVVVQSFGQLRRMQRAAATASASYKSPSGGVSTLPLKASITLAGRLDESGPLAPIWWPLLPATSAPTPSTFYSSG
ncbi:MAG TPA: replication-relaxation family protein [Ktedonobacterales bacterium]